MSKPPAKAASRTSATQAPGTTATAAPAVKPSAKKTAAPAGKAAAVAGKAAPKSSAKPVSAPSKSVAVPKKAAAKPVTNKTSARAPLEVAVKQPSAKPAAVAPALPKNAPAAPATKTQTKAVTAPTPPQQTPPKAPAKSLKPATRLRSSRAAQAQPVDIHPPSIPLPPPSRPPPSNVIDMPRPVRKIDPKLANVWKTKAGRDLTEDELLAMPDSEYMKEKQLEFFRAELMKQRNDLLDNAGQTTVHLREDTSIVPDPADRATIEEEHALELRTRDRERKLLKKISQSIARIETGEYGYCDETGEPIGLGRLLARPTATLSLEAQQRREMKQKMFGD